jgi:Flp pilus assembly pilin Flp
MGRGKRRTQQHCFLARLAKDEDGQALTEYVLIMSAVLVGAVGLAKGILNVLDRGVLRLGGQLEKDLKTGRAPVHVWRN